MVGNPETLATTPSGLASRIAARISADTYAFLLTSIPGRSQDRIEEVVGPNLKTDI